jgi:3-oxoacyl-[acyl-carrier-protein] synthase II
MPNSHVSIYNDFRGPNNAITDRDASMNLALAEATSIIQRGAADVMLVGATGTRLHPLRTLQMSLLENIAAERDDPTSMPRPFDSDCDGMVLGEGAAAIILESQEYAEARSAKVWGEILGYGAACYGPNCNGEPMQLAMQASIARTLKSVGTRLPPKWHLHAQGLGAPAADRAEAAALSHILRDYPDTPVTAAKSYFGNLGAGAAAIELICSLLAMEHQRLFPIKNLNSPIESVRWQPATADSSAGDAVLHTSCNSQGQAASLMVGLA